MKHKFIFAIFILLLSTLRMQAQNVLKGNVKDAETKEKLAGATIYISELKTGTSTDTAGNYFIPNISKGKYLVEVKFLGYKNVITSIIIEGEVKLDFEISPSISELNEVVVTGVSHSTELRKSPVIIKPVDMKELNENGATNLIDALKNVPGVSQITTGASISKPVIRGMGYNRVISLFNGIKQEGQQWGDEHGLEIDEYTVDRVEIIKGPGSLIYGSDGIAGVINFLSPKPLDEGNVKTYLTSNYQTNNQLIGYSLANAGNKKGIQWLGRFTNKNGSNYSSRYDGKVYNSGFKEYDGSLFLGLTKKWGYTHLTVSSFNQTLNLPEGERDSLGHFIKLGTDSNGNITETTATSSDLNGYHIGYPHQGINHFRAVSNNYFIFKNSSLNMDLAYQQNLRKEFGNPADANDIALFFDLNTLNYNVKYNFKPVYGWELTTGIGGMYQTNKNKGAEFLIPEYSLFDVGGFVFAEKHFSEKLTAAGGIRYDNRSMNAQKLILDSNGKLVDSENDSTYTKFNSFRHDYANYSGSAGLSYSLDQNSTLKFNLSRGFRAPNIAEISSNGKHEGTFKYEYGAENLKAEISHQIDLAYYYNSNHFTFELTPFVNFIQNYIYTEKLRSYSGSDSIADASDPTPAYTYTQGKAQLYGGEILTDIHPHPFDWLHIENSFAYVRAIQLNQPDSLMNLPLIPAPKYRGELKAQFKKMGKAFQNVYVKCGVEYYFEQNNYFSAYNTETVTPAYTLLNAGLGGDVKLFKEKVLSIFISGSNLTDVAYQSNLSRLKYAPVNPATGRTGVYNMGRNFSVKLLFTI